MGSQKLQLPTINFKGLDPNQPLGSNWETARAEVFATLESYGCFNGLYDGFRPEVTEVLFQSIMPEIFALPLEVMQLTELSYTGYVGNLTDVAYETIAIPDASNPSSIERFARKCWPEGNQKFCYDLCAKWPHSEQIVERMIFQSLGIEKDCNSLLESLTYEMHFSDYGGLPMEEAKVSLPPHIDPNFITIIRHNGVDGLEVITKDGECIRVVSFPDTFTVIIGEAMKVLTNGRFNAPVHSVSVNQKRYSLPLSSVPKEGYVIQPSEDIVDGNHALQFPPFDYHKYLDFKFTPEGLRTENSLKAFFEAPEQKNNDSYDFYFH